MTARAELERLAGRVEQSARRDNSLDVLIEVALFEPDTMHASARPNAAGTKVIYTTCFGIDETYWAPEWTSRPDHAAAALRARAASLPSDPERTGE